MTILAWLMLAANTSFADMYTYNIQQAGYEYQQYDEKSEVDFDGFVVAFREFPWLDQVGLNTGGSEPTISVKSRLAGTDL